MNKYFAIGAVACLLITPLPAAQVQTPEKSMDQFVIGLQDVLSVIVWREPELSVKEVVVRPDGRISLPLVNDIQAAGLTPRQLQEAIANKLREYVSAPQVTVTLIRILSQTVSLVGEVEKPGVYPLGAPMTVLDLLARSGGFRETAKTKKIKVVRHEGDRVIQFDFNFRDVSAGKKLEQNISLKNGDVVIVP